MQIHNRPLTRTFTLCGFWEGKEAAAAQEIAVSRKWADEIAPVETIPFYETDGKDYSGYLNPGFDFSNSWNIEKKVEKLTERCDFDPAKVNDGVNWAYGFASVDAGTALLIAAVLLLILVSGYLIIYNIFYLNVFGDIRFYGLLKTIGATGKQLKNIVYRQAWTLCVVGIPIGLLAGWLIGRVLTLVIMSMLTVGETYYSANPLIFIGSAIFAWFTVWLSCRKPCRMAAKVSPVEAIGMTGKQQKRMLQYEGLAYALWTAVITCTIGIAVGYVIVQLVAGQAWIFTWHFTMVPVLVCFPFLFLIAFVVPVVCYRRICGKQSIVEQLRVVE